MISTTLLLGHITRGTKAENLEPALKKNLPANLDVEDTDSICKLLKQFDSVTLCTMMDMHPSNMLYCKALAYHWEHVLVPMGITNLHLLPNTWRICNARVRERFWEGRT